MRPNGRAKPTKAAPPKACAPIQFARAGGAAGAAVEPSPAACANGATPSARTASRIRCAGALPSRETPEPTRSPRRRVGRRREARAQLPSAAEADDKRIWRPGRNIKSASTPSGNAPASKLAQNLPGNDHSARFCEARTSQARATTRTSQGAAGSRPANGETTTLRTASASGASSSSPASASSADSGGRVASLTPRSCKIAATGKVDSAVAISRAHSAISRPSSRRLAAGDASRTISRRRRHRPQRAGAPAFPSPTARRSCGASQAFSSASTLLRRVVQKPRRQRLIEALGDRGAACGLARDKKVAHVAIAANRIEQQIEMRSATASVGRREQIEIVDGLGDLRRAAIAVAHLAREPAGLAARPRSARAISCAQRARLRFFGRRRVEMIERGLPPAWLRRRRSRPRVRRRRRNRARPGRPCPARGRSVALRCPVSERTRLARVARRRGKARRGEIGLAEIVAAFPIAASAARARPSRRRPGAAPNMRRPPRRRDGADCRLRLRRRALRPPRPPMEQRDLRREHVAEKAGNAQGHVDARPAERRPSGRTRSR